jgi:hypothetical protein
MGRGWWMYGLSLCAALLVGCGGAKLPYDTATIGGLVTLDGAPVETRVINFISDGPGPGGAATATIVNGQFTAPRVPRGPVRVFIVATRETGKLVSGSSELVPEVESLIPDHYLEGIALEVTGDETDRRFALTSQSSPQP